jgi:biopolymer transport protein ExbD/biopolymer transport protein TolR
MSRRRRSERFALNAEINVVNLIDVMLLLMVIFMLTAPMMQGGVEVALPRADVRPLDAREGLMVTVSRDERITVGDTPLSLDEFAGSFKAIADREGGGANGVYLRADAGVPYGTIVRLIAVMKNAGMGDVGLVAEPERIQ